MKNKLLIIGCAILMLASCKSGNEKYLNGTWKTVNINNGQVQIESPFEMTSKDMTKELASVKELIKSMDLKISPEKYEKFVVMSTAAEYVDGITADPKTAAENGVKGFQKQKKMTEFVYTSSDITTNGKAGVQQTGTFKLNSKPFQFKHLVYGYDNKLVQLFIASPDKEAAGTAIMDRIVKSIRIK